MLDAYAAATLEFGAAQSEGATSRDRPALVGAPRGAVEHKQNALAQSKPIAESIRRSIASGRTEYWYCSECNQKPPLEFPKSWAAPQNGA